MSTVSQRFTKFLQNIQLTKDQIEDAKTKHSGVTSTLHDRFYGSHKSSGIAYDYESKLWSSYVKSEILEDQSASQTWYLVGSYGKNTAIRPPSDIDILFIMPPDEWEKYNNNLGNGQSRLLQDVRNVLVKRYPRTEIHGAGQVVSVEFDSYAVEVLPAFATAYASYFKYPDTSGGGSWRDTDPKAEKSSLSKSNGTTKGNTIRLIKMMKRWKQHRNVPLKSLGLELTVCDFLRTYGDREATSSRYHLMVRDYLEYLTLRSNWSFPIPGINESLHLGDGWLSRAQTALGRATKACEYEDVLYCPRCATDEWKKIFGSDFEYLD